MEADAGKCRKMDNMRLIGTFFTIMGRQLKKGIYVLYGQIFSVSKDA